MKSRLRVPKALVAVVISTGAIAAAVAACGKDEDTCIRCLPDPQVGDAGTDGGAQACPACLPMDGVCPEGCIPEGYV
jgi:hypothetical protein